MPMLNWRPWIIGISLLALGALLFFAGFFLGQFSGPLLPEFVSRGLLLAGFALVALHSTSGINTFVWSIRANFDDAEIRRLKQLRTKGTLAVVPMAIGLTLPLISSAFETIRGEISHNSVVLFSFALTAFGLVLGGLNRAAEFRLLKQSSARTGHFTT
jgi:nicotinamide riboside transporter PnuC